MDWRQWTLTTSEAPESHHISEGEEQAFRQWCAERLLDPEDVGTAVAYEEWWFDTYPSDEPYFF